MDGKRNRKLQRGQGFVEYALVLVLVALVVIVAAFLVGQATQRIFGIVVGSVGGKGSSGDVQIVAAWCIAERVAHATGLVVLGITHETPNGRHYDNLYASTDNQATMVGGIANPTVDTYTSGTLPTELDPGLPGENLQFNPYLSQTTADTSLCPHAITIQDKTNNWISAWPVTSLSWPTS